MSADASVSVVLDREEGERERDAHMKSLHSSTSSVRWLMAPSGVLGVPSMSTSTWRCTASSTCALLLPPICSSPSSVKLARTTNGPTEAGSAALPSLTSCCCPCGWLERIWATLLRISVGAGEDEGEGRAQEVESAKGDRDGYDSSRSAERWVPISQLCACKPRVSSRRCAARA